MTRPLIDPRMLGRLSRFYPSSVTIQQASTSLAADGQPVASWSDVTGLTGLAGSVGPVDLTRADRAETRRPEFTEVARRRLISLAGAYPTITSAMRAVVDGTDTYNILAVELDSHGVTTRLYGEAVSV